MSDKTWKIIFVLIIVLIIVLIAYIYRDKLFTKANAATTNNIANTGSQIGFPLKKGSKGSSVSALQAYLLTKDASCLPKYGVDGDWGDETEACVKKIFGTDVITYQQFKSLGL